MSDSERDNKTPFSKIVNAKKLEEAILNVFTAEELNTATENKVFSWSDGLLDLVADSKNPLAESARKVRFVKTLALGQFLEDFEKTEGSEHIDFKK